MTRPSNPQLTSPVRGEHVEMKDRLLTIREVAALTKLSVGGLYHRVSAKELKVVRFSRRCIRFRYSDVLEWIETHTEEIVDQE
jgi:excisionase family DNA binding protein